MAIYEAIKHLSGISPYAATLSADEYRAIRLGIEALERLEEIKAVLDIYFTRPLPSESE
jgi:hypothetical protein